MLATIVVSVVAFAALIALMAMGVMLQGKRLKGSCGGSDGSCGCSPQKKAACKAKKVILDVSEPDPELEEETIFRGPEVTAETLAAPGEKRLSQLRDAG